MKARLLIVFAAILLLLPSMPGKGLAQENPKLRIEGECFGNNYIHVVVYMDNPPDITTRRPLKPDENCILKVSAGKETEKFRVDIPSSYSTGGKHSVDIYVGFPGNNEALVDVKLVPVRNGSSQQHIGRYRFHNIPPNFAGSATPTYQASFTIDSNAN